MKIITQNYGKLMASYCNSSCIFRPILYPICFIPLVERQYMIPLQQKPTTPHLNSFWLINITPPRQTNLAIYFFSKDSKIILYEEKSELIVQAKLTDLGS